MDKNNPPKTHVEQIDAPKPLRAANEKPSIQEEKVLGAMDDASTTTPKETTLSVEDKKQIIEKGKEASIRVRGGDRTSPQDNSGKTWAQRVRQQNSSTEMNDNNKLDNNQFEPKDYESKPDLNNQPTETKTPEPIEPASSNTETSNIDDQGNLNKLQEPQKAGEERPANSKLQGFIEDARTFAKNYFVPSAKIGGMIVGGATTLFDPSDTVDEATEQQAIKDWVEKNQSENNVNAPSEKSVKEDNDFDNVMNQGTKEENLDTVKKEPQPQNQLERLSQVGYPQDEAADQFNSMPQTLTENANIQLALNDFSSQPSIDDNTSSFDEISKEDFYLMTKTDVSDQSYKTDEFENDNDRNRFLSMMNNLDAPNPGYDSNPEVEEKEAFLSVMNNLDSYYNNSEVANSGNELGQDEKENFLLAMNDLDSPSKRDDIGSFYWETEVYESKLERGEIDEDGTPDVGGMDGGDD